VHLTFTILPLGRKYRLCCTSRNFDAADYQCQMNHRSDSVPVVAAHLVSSGLGARKSEILLSRGSRPYTEINVAAQLTFAGRIILTSCLRSKPTGESVRAVLQNVLW
jgi:hypothetical protein